jgi:signal transduction histidine kinase
MKFKRIFFVTLFVLFHQYTQAQNPRRWDTRIDSLQSILDESAVDSVKIQTSKELIEVLINKAWTNTNTGQFALAYESFGKAFEFWQNSAMRILFTNDDKNAELTKFYWSTLSNLNFNYGHLMGVTGNTEERLFYYQKAYQISKVRDDVMNSIYALSGMAFVHLNNNEIDSARIKIGKSMSYAPELYNYEGYSELSFIDGSIKLEAKEFESASKAFMKGIKYAKDQNYVVGIAANNLGLSKAYRQLNSEDSSYFYGNQAIRVFRRIKEIQMFDIDIASAHENLYEHFQYFNQPDSAFKYLVLAHLERGVLTKRKLTNLAEFQKKLLNQERLLSELEKENLAIQSKYKNYFFLAILVVFLVIGAILLRGYHQKRKANLLLANQKDEVQATLNQLKATQAQLVQQEKLASLGQLTAGIAHEIQNPLNFVNNFSEVSAELVEEIKEARTKSQETRPKTTEDEIEDEILEDIKQNLEKITLHGKRADAIVKGMLEHSRSNKGKKAPTDLNALADEFLRLSHQSFLAKNPDFKCDIKTNLAPDLPQVSVIPQDIGKVLLNLLNNAFYACGERSNKDLSGFENLTGLNPLVTVSTKNLGDSIEISVQDNGPGIPDSIKEKIFQPFFTTKPTGSGTGLGLSLSYDIVKAHGGELKVESVEGKGSEFSIFLLI